MRLSLRLRLPAMALALLGLCAPPASAGEEALAIQLTAPVIQAQPSAQTPCRTLVRFTGIVTFGNAAPPGDVTYHIRYSDGSTGSDTVVKHQAAGLSSQTLDMRTFYQATDGWAELDFSSPLKMQTTRQNFHVTCAPIATVVSISKATVSVAAAPLPDQPCRQAVTFANTISAPDLDPNLPRVMTYRFLRSDGYTSKTYTHTFTKTTTKVTHDTWNLFTAAHGWERVEILSPTHILSDEATFVTSCSGKATTSGANTGDVDIEGSSVTQTAGAGACAYVLDFHTSLDASHWPGTDRTLRYRAVRSTGKIFAHVLPNFTGPQLVHSEWKVHAPFSGWVQFQVTSPNTLSGKKVQVSISHC